MKQSIVLSILLLLLSSSSLVTPIHARNKAKSPSLSPLGSPAPGPSSNSDCSSVIFSMLDCLTYLTVGSNETKPVKSCCVGIETVVAYNPQCICAGLDSGKQMGVDLNTTRALATPKACKLDITPPHCGIISAATPGGASVPVTAPVSPSSGTPTTSPSTTNAPATSPTSAEPTSETAPSPSKSGSNNLSVPALTVVAIIGFSAFLINFSF
ncbi:Non-specific lipid transfer protein GPI-anchored 4 [Cardamine amara subsp. amara]|uniref:Non-specific lipid transfer protein GPI-anchored 4 n=1 Tax=Cardamine amara subsp. amara TaxID=228776 RepID=A0ABD0ZU11_CARAN